MNQSPVSGPGNRFIINYQSIGYGAYILFLAIFVDVMMLWLTFIGTEGVFRSTTIR